MRDPKSLRQSLKRARRELPDNVRAAAQARLIRALSHYRPLLKAKRIALYIGTRGEFDPTPLVDTLMAQNKQWYLPVLHPFRHGRLLFAEWQRNKELTLNRFGIPEPNPRSSKLLPARALDVVVVPLLGFDANCHRLGMGGGYYDRSFAFRRYRTHLTGPHLLGAAFDVQRVDELEQQPWDVRLDAIMTDAAFYSRVF